MLLERAADRPAEPAALAERLERWLASRGWSLAQLTAATRDGVRGDRRMRIPEGFAARIRRGRAPHVYQLLALSEAAGADLYECLTLFGYDLEDIPLLQAALHQDRTVALPVTVYDRERAVDWPSAFDATADPSRGEFVAELASSIEPRPVSMLNAACHPDAIYVRIGRHARTLVPAVVPGSIVRVDTSDRTPSRTPPGRTRHVYLVAHVRGLTCTYVDWIDEERIALVPEGHASPPVICRLGEEAVVLGRVRDELRPMDVGAEKPAAGSGRDHCAPRLVLPDPERQTFGRFLRSARELIGMTHREAHEISTKIADAYGDRRFAIGVGTLSDWESQDDLPLHVPHLFSLSVCYSVSFGDLLRAATVVDRDPFMTPFMTLNAEAAGDVPAVPPALLHALRISVRRSNLSWDDVFRVGARAAIFDRSLVGARYLILDRRDRRLARVDASAAIDRPLYVLSDPQGRHLCSGCFAAGENLYIHPDPRLNVKLRAVPRGCLSIRGRVLAVLRER